MTDVATVGMACGAALVSIEMGSVAALAFARESMQRRFPRLARHCGVAAKTTSYRFFAGLDTFLLSFLVTGHAGAAAGIVGFELCSKFALYYAHEWAWSLSFLQRLTKGV
jgi:uncharacterized membrane protein